MERETEQLLMRYLEGELDTPSMQAFEDQLRADAALREEFVRFARQERVLRTMLIQDDAQLSDQVLNRIRAEKDGEAFVASVQREIGEKRGRAKSHGRQGSSARRRSLRLRLRTRPGLGAFIAPLAIAATLLAAAGIYLAFQTSVTTPELVAVLTELRGAEGATANAEIAGKPAQAGAKLQPGQTLSLGRGTQASLRYPDGTRVDLRPESRVTLLQPDGPAAKHLRLEQGTLTADVTPQPANAPLVASTTLARATVRGTVFTLTAGAADTRLDVRHGRVQLERLADGADVMVAEGQFAVAGTDLAAALVARSSAVQTAATRDAKPEDFLSRVFTQGNARLPYRLFVPQPQDPARKFPLVLFLHGIGEKGTDNAKPLGNNANGAMVFVSATAQAANPCFMLVPQSESGWWGAYADLIPQLLKELSGEYRIDMDRVYVTGLSSGGTGVWEMLIRNPSLFAAAVPICGSGDAKKAALLVDIPIWNFHTADDPTMPVKGSRNMIDAIRQAGGKPFYTEYPTGGHGSSWVRAYKDPSLVEWVMAQRRGRPVSAPAGIPNAR
jgi:predicted esterase/anti-sigma factor RsiW